MSYTDKVVERYLSLRELIGLIEYPVTEWVVTNYIHLKELYKKMEDYRYQKFIEKEIDHVKNEQYSRLIEQSDVEKYNKKIENRCNKIEVAYNALVSELVVFAEKDTLCDDDKEHIEEIRCNIKDKLISTKWKRYFLLINDTILKNETFLEFYEYIRDNNETMNITKIKEVASKLKLDQMYIGEEYERALKYGECLISLTDEKIKKEYVSRMEENSYFRNLHQNKEKEYIIDFRERVNNFVPALLRRNNKMLKCISNMNMLYGSYFGLYKDEWNDTTNCIGKSVEYGKLNHSFF